jgi:hypothetical protein
MTKIMEIATEKELNTSNLMLEIKKLRESIEGLTNAIIDRIEKPQIRVCEPTPVEVETKSVGIAVAPVNFKVTNDMVKQLAKEKMAAGVDRSKIKSIITSLAGSDASIIDLDESNLEECYNKISELQPENK